jgi:hypothetical protein
LLVLGFCSSSCSLPCFYRVWGWLVCKDLAIGFKVAGRDESSADGERPGVFAEINLVSKISTIGDVHMHIVVTKLNNSGLRRRNRIDRTPILLKNQARCWEVHIHSIRMEKVRSAKPTIRNMASLLIIPDKALSKSESVELRARYILAYVMDFRCGTLGTECSAVMGCRKWEHGHKLRGYLWRSTSSVPKFSLA